ncbi:MAG: ABC transporter substrate-binding protein [Bacteroidetes bacterium MedPE-SWsnd-G1]|nr:MAG: ABC transporter substrate-binding protein [Bacteroidetes bacterium MedPE-SWsnd-G1]
MKLTREFKTGFVSVIIIGVFIWGYNFMKGQNLFNTAPRTYFAKYANVDGLNTASNVTINGLPVGKVLEITFDKDPMNRGQLIVEFGVDNDFEFSDKSIVKIYSTSLMGGKALAIMPSYEGEIAKSGSYLKGDTELDMFASLSETLGSVQAKVESVLVNADSLLLGLNQVLNAEARKDLQETFSGLNKTVANFKTASDSLDEILNENKEKLNTSLSNVETITTNFAKISDSLANANLGETMAKLEITVNSFNAILTGMENGEGSLGKLLKDEALYTNLENAAKEMEELLREMKEHPKRFVHFSMFGKKDKGYQSEEKE